ncbi:chloroplastic [Listeria monocytogenes N53-1]|nr:chloroplastic [Listeria monocytogenes N53-1]
MNIETVEEISEKEIILFNAPILLQLLKFKWMKNQKLSQQILRQSKLNKKIPLDALCLEGLFYLMV